MNNRVFHAAALAVVLAVPAEGLRYFAYYDPPGILTACRGHTGPDVMKGVRYSLEQCDKWLTDDMRKAIATVDACQPGLPVEILAAFGDAVFNLGRRVACGPDSTAATYLRLKHYAEACNQLPRWNKASIAGIMVELPGLTTRRAKERDLCLTAVVP